MWKIVTDDNYMNQQLIFPAAQKDIGKIIENAKQYESVQEIIVFGSAVTSSFNPTSDIDIFVKQSDSHRYLLGKGLVRGVDYWTREDCDEALLKEIIKNGVIIYKR